MALSTASAQTPEALSALTKGLRVLTSFSDQRLALGNKEIADLTGLPKSTISRLTYTLAALGYLRYESSSARYSLTPHVLTVAKPILRRGASLRGLLHPLLREHADRYEVAAGLGTAKEGGAIYLDACLGRGANGLGFKIGGRLPLATSAMGRALFAAMTDGDRQRCVEQIEADFQRDVASRMIEGLYRAVDEVQRVGFCTCEGELTESIRGIGVPLRIKQGNLVFALNCGGRKSVVAAERLMRVVGPATVALANRIASHDLTLPGRY